MLAPIKKEPFKGASHTVSTIIKSALESQEAARRVVEDVCRNLRSKDYLSEMLALCHFVTTNTRYMRDPTTIELVRAPYVIIEEIYSGLKPQLDCDDMTALLLSLLLSVGCQARVVTVAFKNAFFKGERQYAHVFVQGYEPRSKKWVTLDPVAGEGTKSMHSRIVAAKIYPVV